jgi:hypothetical protein
MFFGGVMLDAIQEKINRFRERVIQDALPDKCRITPPAYTTVGAEGIPVETNPIPIVWRGETEIPCRIDQSTAFRPEQMYTQTIITNEYLLVLPFDVEVKPEYNVYLETGQKFEIRAQHLAYSAWDEVRK